MAEIKKIVKRRDSAKNIKKITKTMSLIAAAKFKSVAKRVQGIKTYTEKLNLIVDHISQGSLQHPLLENNESDGPTALVVITSKRGLCGAYNTNVLNFAVTVIKKYKEEGRSLELHLVGQKGVKFFSKNNRGCEVFTYDDTGDIPDYEVIQKFTQKFIDRYEEGKIKEVQLIYMGFQSASQQHPETSTLLPFKMSQQESTTSAQRDYLTHPDSQTISDYIVPQSIRINFFRVFLEAATSEHVQRMIAMNSATDNAGKMIKELTKLYNRARQAKITNEISEIMGGVRALESTKG